jgi:FkbM family methyltransferase
VRGALIDRARKRAGFSLARVPYPLFRTLLPASGEVELAPGLRTVLDFSDETQRVTYWQGWRYEAPTPQILTAWTAASGSVFFDIGANYGFYSYLVAAHSPSAHIHAFEPNEKMASVISQTRGRNGLDRLEIHTVGLSDEASELELHLGDADSGHATFGDHPMLAAGRAKAAVVPFDDWRRQNGLALPDGPRWVAKLDVEGFELKVLRGMHEALGAQAFRGLAVEMNEYTLEFCQTTAAEIDAFLVERGYRKLVTGTPPEQLAGVHNDFYVPATDR